MGRPSRGLGAGAWRCIVIGLLVTTGCTSSQRPAEAVFGWSLPDPAQTGRVVTDLYRWDGAFVKRLNPGMRMSIDGRYGIDAHGAIWTADGKQVGELADDGLGYQWADDTPDLCRFNSGTGELVIANVQGKVLHRHLVAGSADYGPGLARCDVASGRAVFVYLRSIQVVSVVDAHVIGVFATTQVPWPANEVGPVGMPAPILAVSPDARWMAEVVSESPGRPEIDVVSLVTGATAARLAYGLDAEYGFNLGFSADGNKLVIGDDDGPAVRMIDWRSGRQEWSRPGLSIGISASDRATNKVLVQVWNGEPGGNTATYWIVDSSGRAFQFTPRPYNAPD